MGSCVIYHGLCIATRLAYFDFSSNAPKSIPEKALKQTTTETNMICRKKIRTMFETAIIGIEGYIRFAWNGDSGSAIVNRDGHIFGMLHAGQT